MKQFLLAAAVTLLASSAWATPMTFSYEYSDGSILSGSIDGTVQGDNDTVVINSFGDVMYNGNLFDSIDTGEFASVSDFPDGLLDPTFSFSGAIMDVITCPMGFDGSANCDFASDSGFYFVQPSVAFFDVGVGGGMFSSLFENFSADRWSLTEVSAVSEPASFVLFGIGLLAWFGSRRKS